MQPDVQIKNNVVWHYWDQNLSSDKCHDLAVRTEEGTITYHQLGNAIAHFISREPLVSTLSKKARVFCLFDDNTRKEDRKNRFRAK